MKKEKRKIIPKELTPTSTFNISKWNGKFFQPITNCENIKPSKEELLENIKKSDITREQLQYIKALLSLEISIFEDDKLNKELLHNPYFLQVAKQHLFEDSTRIIKNACEDNTVNKVRNDKIIDLNDTVILHSQENDWQKIITFGNIVVIPLLEAIINSEKSELTIYESKNEDNLDFYISKIKAQGREKELDFWLNERKVKIEALNNISRLLLKHWDLRDFETIDENQQVKRLSFIDVKKISIE